jgi:DNA polymerase-3 subunit delta'
VPFSDIVGQDRAVKILKRELLHQRIPQAYLFCGPESSGKLRSALTLAMVFLCDQASGDACGTCASCRKIVLGQHADVRLYGPTARTKGALEKIYIDQIRGLQQEISLRPMEGKRKIFIIDDADCMVDQAANALLKTLEEPPGDSLLILVAAQPDHLPFTILSRCRRLRFQPLSDESVARILVQDKGVEPDQARLLARCAQGNVGKAMAVDYDDLAAQRQRFLQKVGELKGMDIPDLFTFSEKFTRNTADALDFMAFMLGWVRDMIAVKVMGPRGALTHGELSQELSDISDRHSLDDLLVKFDLVKESLGMLHRNANARLALESALIQMGVNKGSVS